MHITLNSYGVSLNAENELFVISTNEGKQALHPDKIKTITVSKGARLSSDAVLLAIKFQIDVLFVDKLGYPAGRVWSIKYGSVSEIRRKQLEFLYSDAAEDWVKKLLAQKLERQIALLLSFQPAEAPLFHRFSAAMNSITDHKRKILSLSGESFSDLKPTLRGWEGAASKKYFEAINLIMPNDYQFAKRSQNPATDPFNAMLNYGYGILYGKVEGALIKAGIDPYTGVFHRDDYNRPALVFDVIEIYRHWADYVVISLAKNEAIPLDCFSIQSNGACLLEGLAKRILIQSMQDYMAEIIEINGRERSRNTHIEDYTRQLAQVFLKS